MARRPWEERPVQGAPHTRDTGPMGRARGNNSSPGDNKGDSPPPAPDSTGPAAGGSGRSDTGPARNNIPTDYTGKRHSSSRAAGSETSKPPSPHTRPPEGGRRRPRTGPTRRRSLTPEPGSWR